jgi:hypothetical protein
VDNWVKNTVMIVVIAVWTTVVITSLVRGIPPDPVTWGIPGGVYFALNPTIPWNKKESHATTEVINK